MGKYSDTWWKSVGNELGGLANGIDKLVRETNTIDFIIREEVPKCCTIKYSNFVCDYRPLKSEPYRVRLTVGGDRIEYPDDSSLPASFLLGSKLLFNSKIPDARRGARFKSCDLKYFFLETPMSSAKYMRIHSKYLAPDIRYQYNIEDLIAAYGYGYIKIIKGMYGLNQSDIIAYNQLIYQMDTHDYYPLPFTAGLWAHNTRKKKNCLCVDDFGVNIFCKDDANHLLNSLKSTMPFQRIRGDTITSY